MILSLLIYECMFLNNREKVDASELSKHLNFHLFLDESNTQKIRCPLRKILSAHGTLFKNRRMLPSHNIHELRPIRNCDAQVLALLAQANRKISIYVFNNREKVSINPLLVTVRV